MNHIQMAHLLMEAFIKPGDHVLDMTLGNGHDMQKLLGLCGPSGMLTGFDIAAEAIARCREIAAGFPGYSIELKHKCHAECGDIAPFRFAVYNLGYLPGSDKTVTTRAETTIRSVQTLLPKMQEDGMICITAYRTHDNNKEADQLHAWLSEQTLASVRSWARLPDDGHSPILYALYNKENRH